MIKNINLIGLILGAVTCLAGYTLLVMYANWGVALGVFLLHFSINIDISDRIKRVTIKLK